MVVAGILALALALPTGALFGIGYGTGVRIGYEQIYPLLFPAKEDGTRDTASTVQNVKAINDIYNAIGGKEASQMGIATGLSSAMSELDKNPDFQALLKLESSLSGNTSSSSGPGVSKGSKISQRPDTFFNADTPGGFLQNPIIQLPFEEGPPNIEDKYGYSSMTRTELLNNQPSQMQPRPSNIVERQTQWNHYYQKALADFVQSTPAPPVPPTPPKTSANKLQTTYVVKRAELLTDIIRKAEVEKRQRADSIKYNLNGNKIRLDRAIKLLQNHITLARNNPATKALANNDWNKRIWNV